MAIVDVVDGWEHEDLVAATYERVLRPSFSREELPDAGVVAHGLDGSGTTVLSIAVEGGTPVAAALTEHTPEVDIDLLGYLAARPGDRDRGLGAALLDHLAERWRERATALALAEIHDPRAWPERPDERSSSRVRFYARWGCEVLEAPWVQPALQPGLSRVPDMLLAVLARTPATVPTVPSAPVVAWAAAYYELAEGVDVAAPTADPQVAALMQRLAGERGLDVFPLAEYERVAPLVAG